MYNKDSKYEDNVQKILDHIFVECSGSKSLLRALSTKYFILQILSFYSKTFML